MYDLDFFFFFFSSLLGYYGWCLAGVYVLCGHVYSYVRVCYSGTLIYFCPTIDRPDFLFLCFLFYFWVPGPVPYELG